ncbi:hypothetical protein CR513_47679, partial [Mucuna pruriens]
MVKKDNWKWRMCTNYTDLNKACSKDPYPLPSIDRLVDGASGFALLSFMDAYSGYNQIKMHPQEETKSVFITDAGAYCYKHLMSRIFEGLIGDDVEVYVDDIVVKLATVADHCKALGIVFQVLRKHRLKLNPKNALSRSKLENFWGSQHFHISYPGQ